VQQSCKNFVELGLANKKCVVLRLYFATGIHEIDVGTIVDRHHLGAEPPRCSAELGSAHHMTDPMG